MAPSYTVTLPTPPSLNTAYRNVPRMGRVKTQAYKDWEKLAETYRPSCALEALQGDVKAVYAYGRKDRRRTDLDNKIKLVSDRLTAWGVWLDDSQVVDIRAYWADDVAPGFVRVMLETI